MNREKAGEERQDAADQEVQAHPEDHRVDLGLRGHPISLVGVAGRHYTGIRTRHQVSRPSRVLYALAGVGLAALGVEALALRRVRRPRLPPTTSHPGVSVLKPLSGSDPELEADLESHAALDYPGEWEIVVGLQDEADPAAPAARAFLARHPDRARLVVVGERVGHHPKINQVIFLTRAARHDVLVVTDANARLAAGHLREVVSALEREGVGVATALVAAHGERSVGAVVDNQVWLTFVMPNVAVATALGIEQVVGKSLGIRRDVLERIGGWEAVKDVLGDDKTLGSLIDSIGLRPYVCPTPVDHVQVDKRIATHWARQTRWAAIRFRLLRPGFFLEPLLNPILLVERRPRPLAPLAAGGLPDGGDVGGLARPRAGVRRPCPRPRLRSGTPRPLPALPVPPLRGLGARRDHRRQRDLARSPLRAGAGHAARPAWARLLGERTGHARHSPS